MILTNAENVALLQINYYGGIDFPEFLVAALFVFQQFVGIGGRGQEFQSNAGGGDSYDATEFSRNFLSAILLRNPQVNVFWNGFFWVTAQKIAWRERNNSSSAIVDTLETQQWKRVFFTMSTPTTLFGRGWICLLLLAFRLLLVSFGGWYARRPKL
jgi:hypothetical protein